ncbi:uncharacterized protein LOC110436776 isoform X2 [Sorghum bicolor]|uniref:uncharacterized protein LOC110436776 isoform X2 n=1 Tax=Sorghum bicolor TaxID=4558 RepID=UPI000B4255EF|nr:uncharacterized protein LOC110436776 isoform X2 [Sorghum bicolor]|eukprot:XP_021319941.1 uncharacterized protein LOC110436776 isoform X2 [Sorghum bicolor]
MRLLARETVVLVLVVVGLRARRESSQSKEQAGEKGQRSESKSSKTIEVVTWRWKRRWRGGMQRKEDAAMPCHGPAVGPQLPHHAPYSLSLMPPIDSIPPRPRPGVSIHTYTAGGGDGDGISLSGGGVPGKQPTDRPTAYKSEPPRAARTGIVHHPAAAVAACPGVDLLLLLLLSVSPR